MKMSSRFLVLLLAAGTGLQAKNYTLNQYTSSKCDNNAPMCYKQKFSNSNKKCRGCYYEIKVGDTVTIETSQTHNGTRWLPGTIIKSTADTNYFTKISDTSESIKFKAIQTTPKDVLTQIIIKRTEDGITGLNFEIKK